MDDQLHDASRVPFMSSPSSAQPHHVTTSGPCVVDSVAPAAGGDGGHSSSDSGGASAPCKAKHNESDGHAGVRGWRKVMKDGGSSLRSWSISWFLGSRSIGMRWSKLCRYWGKVCSYI